jgi:hypothetical protein
MNGTDYKDYGPGLPGTNDHGRTYEQQIAHNQNLNKSNKDFSSGAGSKVPETHARSSDTDASKEKNWLQKVDGQGNGGQGGRLSKASDVFAKLAQNTPGSVHRGVDYNKNVAIREGASKNELAQSDEIGNYDAWLKRQNKKKNSNYA